MTIRNTSKQVVKQDNRRSNIELLRIFAMLGVIVLHYNHVDAGGGFKYVVEGSVNYYILYILESLTICAVDLFMLISGYFLYSTKRRDMWKPIELICQVALFGFVISLVRHIVAGGSITIKTIIIFLVPANYFVILYSAVYLISPYLNILIENLSHKQLSIFTGVIVGLFSVYPTLVDVFIEVTHRDWLGLSTIGMYGSQWGYSIVNFTLMYIIGAVLRVREESIKHISQSAMVVGLLVCVAVMTVWGMINQTTAWEYCNPFVIMAAVLMFCLFSRLEFGYCKQINHLAKATLTVFLLHGVFLPHISAERFVTGNPLLMVAHIGVSAIGIYMICWMVHCMYNAIMKPVFKKLKTWIPLPSLDLT